MNLQPVSLAPGIVPAALAGTRSATLARKHAQPPGSRKPQGSQGHQLASKPRLGFPCRHKISRHSQKLGHELSRAVWLDKGSSEFSLVTRNKRLQLRDLRLQHCYLRLEGGGSRRLPAGGTGWFFSSHQWRP
jgi:hypothetical protein